MKHRVTLTMDPEISHRAKRLARERGKSFSSLVESLLFEQLSKGSTLEKTSHAETWRGKFTLSDQDDPRAQRLREKYGLNPE